MAFHDDTQSAQDMLEVERKFLLKSFPEHILSSTIPPLRYEQGYLPSAGKIHERVTRHWRTPMTYKRCVKVAIPGRQPGEPLVRQEYNETLDEHIFYRFWPLTEGRRLLKVRYRIEEDGLVWEIDVFKDRELVLCEVELSDANAMLQSMPEWLYAVLDRDVTDDPAFLGHNLGR